MGRDYNIMMVDGLIVLIGRDEYTQKVNYRFRSHDLDQVLSFLLHKRASGERLSIEAHTFLPDDKSLLVGIVMGLEDNSSYDPRNDIIIIEDKE